MTVRRHVDDYFDATPSAVIQAAGHSQIGCYIASGLMSILAAGGAMTLARHERKLIPLLVAILLASCGLALVTVLGMLA